MNRNVISETDLASHRAVLGSEAAKPVQSIDGYTDRLVKYIPPDVIGAFSVIEGFLSGSTSAYAPLLSWLVFVVIFIATPFYLYRIGGIRKKPQILISTLAFVVWAFAYPGFPFSLLKPDRTISSIILALFTFLVPLFTV
jgi:hypothetical protein